MHITVKNNIKYIKKAKNDGKVEKTVTLNKPFEGLLITNGIWRELKNFSSGAVCLVVASEVFEEADYIRDFEDFLALSTK